MLLFCPGVFGMRGALAHRAQAGRGSRHLSAADHLGASGGSRHVHRNEFLGSGESLFLGHGTPFVHFVAAVVSVLGEAVMCRSCEEKKAQKSHFLDIPCLSTCNMTTRESVTNSDFWGMQLH